MLVRFRRRLGFPSRNKKRWPPNFDVKKHNIDGTTEIVSVPIKTFPRILTMPVYQQPGLVYQPTSTDEYMWSAHNRADAAAARKTIGETPIEVAPFDIVYFARLLAKIAHGFFMAALKHEHPGFEPILADLILNGSERWRDFVGCAREWPPREEGSLYQLGNGIYTMQDDSQYLSVNIRLLGHWRAPAYEVITAKRA